MEIRLFRAEVDKKIKGELDSTNSPNVHKNVIQQSIQKKYRTVVKSSSKIIQESSPNPKRLLSQSSQSKIVKTFMASNSKLQNIMNFSQGIDLTSHNFTGLINTPTLLDINLKFYKCCCIPRKQEIKATVQLNQSLFFGNEQIKVKVNLKCKKEQSLALIDSVQLSLIQRVTIYSDIKKRSCKSYTSVLDIFKVMEKNNIKNKELFFSFPLDKLLWSEKRFDFICEHVKLKDTRALRYGRLHTIFELSSSNLKTKAATNDFSDMQNIVSIEEMQPRLENQDSKNNQSNQSYRNASLALPYRGENQKSRQNYRSSFKMGFNLPLNNDTVRRVESINFSSHGHTIKNQFFIKLEIKSKSINVTKNEVEVPIKIRERKEITTNALQSKTYPKIPQVFKNDEQDDILNMPGASLQLLELYLSKDSLLLMNNQVQKS